MFLFALLSISGVSALISGVSCSYFAEGIDIEFGVKVVAP